MIRYVWKTLGDSKYEQQPMGSDHRWHVFKEIYSSF